jgi:hypothetical protein
MTNTEKSTMATVSGEKRDRNSDNTDQPTSSPNSKDAKLLCANDKAPIGKPKDEEMNMIAQKKDLVAFNANKDVNPKQTSKDMEEHVTEGKYGVHLEDEEYTPKTLFDSSDETYDMKVDGPDTTGNISKGKEQNNKGTLDKTGGKTGGTGYNKLNQMNKEKSENNKINEKL